MTVPQGMLEYLAVADLLAREDVLRRNPELREFLGSQAARQGVSEWLASDGAWAGPSAAAVEGALDYLRQSAVPDDAAIVKPILLHPAERARLRAYEFLLGLYFPDRNPDAVFLLLTGMLSDESDMVRSAGAVYVERVGATGQLRTFLERWRNMAQARGWAGTESYEQVARLLAGQTP